MKMLICCGCIVLVINYSEVLEWKKPIEKINDPKMNEK